MTLDPIRARIALGWLVEPGHPVISQLVAARGPVDAYAAVLAGEINSPRLREAVTARLASDNPEQIAETILARTHRLGVTVLTPEDTDWPYQVEDLRLLETLTPQERMISPPLLLYLRGAAPAATLSQNAVAIVGARASSSYGNHQATDLSYGLAQRGWSIISGGAYGIDAAAHRGALTAGGTTVAVLACGIDRIYPAGNTALFERIAETGLLVSEWPPGADPHRHRFLTRNRVIAALPRGTVVAEASARSGALATARRALALGRPTMIVPGPVTSAMSVGCHLLARQEPAVRLVTGVAEVLEEVGAIGTDLAPLPRGVDTARDRLTDDAALLLDNMPAGRPCRPDELSARAGLALRVVLRSLPALTDLGLIELTDAGYLLARTRTPR